MDILKNLIDFESRYNEEGEHLCQAYAYVNTPNEHLCTRVADTVKIDISEKIFQLTGYKLGINCCMFCKQHTKSLVLKLSNILLINLTKFAMRHPYITGVSSSDLNTLDFEKQMDVRKRIIKDGGKKKKKSKRRK